MFENFGIRSFFGNFSEILGLFPIIFRKFSNIFGSLWVFYTKVFTEEAAHTNSIVCVAWLLTKITDSEMTVFYHTIVGCGWLQF